MNNKRVRKGEIYLVKFPQTHANGSSEQQGSRPCVIVSNDTGNRFATTVIVSVLTTSVKKSYPMHVALPKGTGGLISDSTLLSEQLFTVDKERLLHRIGDLNQHPAVMKQVDDAIRISLGL